jgi:DNA-binding MarR family transcriptional regulator
MLDRLIQRGLVRKKPSMADGRAMVVSLTIEGTVLRNAIVPLIVKFLEAACAGISGEDIAVTLTTLKRISAQI